MAQDQQMAFDYFRKGEYEKAASVYQSLFDKNPYNSYYLLKLIDSHQQLEAFTIAQGLIENQLKNQPSQSQFLVELGYNYELQHQQKKAIVYYKKALREVDKNKYSAYTIAKSFQDNHLLDYALKAYKKATELNVDANYTIQIASVYGEKGDVKNMFDTYLNAVELDEKYSKTIIRFIGKFITDDSESKYNVLFKSLILKRLQSSPKNAWNELLSWLFMQQKDFSKAFIQEKALYKRTLISMNDIVNVGKIAFDNQDYSTTQKVFNYIIDNSENQSDILGAKLYLLYIAVESSEDLQSIENQFQQLFNAYGRARETLEIQITYADFLTFKKNESNQAINVLKDALKLKSNSYQKGAIKIKLGDILVFNNRFNEALICYSQVQTKLKNHVLAQQARFKVAQTSYFKGDFDWAETQLKVLKGSTSQLIANDALDLSLIINDNSVQDSLKTALKQYAKADLLAYQQKDSEAIDALGIILKEHKGHAIEDETLLKQAELFEKTKEYASAEKNYLQIIEINAEDILVDDAYYRLAELHNKQKNIEKAKEYYQKIIFDFPSSIHSVDARKKYRKLRGDDI
ncbi:MAG: tetratricopeptide (TPR) repeat protein [Urechidicola sp.]|jgi:tetratricopeptide (TPR) repeat protein|tara:strand:- start:2224 stop:3945 length:1722 start_codon:yes stop_codon:yes gene_type:complete